MRSGAFYFLKTITISIHTELLFLILSVFFFCIFLLQNKKAVIILIIYNFRIK